MTTLKYSIKKVKEVVALSNVARKRVGKKICKKTRAAKDKSPNAKKKNAIKSLTKGQQKACINLNKYSCGMVEQVQVIPPRLTKETFYSLRMTMRA